MRPLRWASLDSRFWALGLRHRRSRRVSEKFHGSGACAGLEAGIGPGSTSRWRQSPTFRVIGATAEDLNFIDGVFGEVNGLFAESSVKISRTDEPDAKVTMVFAPLSEWPQHLPDLEGIESYPDRTGITLIDFGGLDRGGWVFVDSDLTGDDRRAATIHQPAHAVGIKGHDVFDPTSVVYLARDTRSSALVLSEFDRRTLQFLYLFLDSYDSSEKGFLDFFHVLGRSAINNHK